MLNYKNCEAFFSVAEFGSFELAATQLNISASAVTLRVQNLENSLGQILLIRDRPCVLTASGELLFNYLQHQQRLEQNVIQSMTGKSSISGFTTIKIGINDDSLNTWFLDAIQNFVIEQQILIHFKIDDQSRTHQLLEQGSVQACISALQIPFKGCQAIPLMRMNYKMVATEAFIKKWFAHGLERESFKKAPAAIYNQNDRLHHSCLETHFGVTENMYPKHFIPSSYAFAQMIFLGMAYGLLPEHQIENRIQAGELIELHEKLQVDVELYWHHWKIQSPALQQMTELLTNL